MLPAKFSISAKSFRTFQFQTLRLLLAISVMLAPAVASLQTFGQQTPGQTLVFPASLQWPRQQGVTWYRLQISADDTFRNVYHDRRVMGDRYRVSDVPPGYYYWRIAPADRQLGAFSRPKRFFVSGGVVTRSLVRSTVFRRAFQ